MHEHHDDSFPQHFPSAPLRREHHRVHRAEQGSAGLYVFDGHGARILYGYVVPLFQFLLSNMASLKWQDSPERSPAHSRAPTGNNPWLMISMGLMGVIVGFGLGSFNGGNLGNTAGSPAPRQIAQAPTPPAPNVPQAPAKPPTADDDPFLGDKNAPVTLIEFTDYQCTFCGRHYANTYGQLKKDYIDTGKVKYVVRDFPLGFHPHAQKAAEATECADDQGKFWEMHGKIFETQGTWSNAADVVPTLKQYAADLKLNTSAFDSCLDGAKYKDEVAKDMADGSASGVNGTPGFWVLGPSGKSQQISGAVPYANFQQAIDAMLP